MSPKKSLSSPKNGVELYKLHSLPYQLYLEAALEAAKQQEGLIPTKVLQTFRSMVLTKTIQELGYPDVTK